MKIIDGGVTAAKGFEASSTAAQIKYKGRTDMALIYSTAPCVTAGTFTTNVVKAAPVIWDRNLVEEGRMSRAVIVNSGIANACTGEEGMYYCGETAKEAAKALDIPEDSVLVGSTGVIGMQLPIDRIKAGVRALAESKKDTAEAGHLAAKAIMTTDTISKETACEIEIGGKTVTFGGMSKGSGMIHPNMCTMLAYVTTDLAIERTLLLKAVRSIANETFNMISVDGDTSTNDTLLVMANGAAGNPIVDKEDEEYTKVYEALDYICRDLARKMAKDGEGATKLIESTVIGADTKGNARTLAKSVITSNLTKAAIYGNDANWGRILCALGYAGVPFDPAKVDMYFVSSEYAHTGEGEKILIFTNGAAAEFDEAQATELLKKDEVYILSDMHMGEQSATAWGCDLTYEYVKINADYRS